MERIALKLGYLGTRYHGFQIQPDAVGPTIEGELFEALQKLEIIEDRVASHYAAAGRTDKGVHALAQVVSFDTARTNVTPRMINSILPDDIWAFAIAKPPPGFNARADAISRAYRYFLAVPPDVDLELTRMHVASELFIGTHDFSNFAQSADHADDEGATPIREIKRIAIETIDIEKRPAVVIIDIEADGFLRKMVRKIVTALRMVGSGMRDKSWVKDLLELRITDQIEPAPAFGLVLKHVSYRGLTFTEDEYAKRRIIARLQEQMGFHATMAAVLGDMVTDYGAVR